MRLVILFMLFESATVSYSQETATSEIFKSMDSMTMSREIAPRIKQFPLFSKKSVDGSYIIAEYLSDRIDSIARRLSKKPILDNPYTLGKDSINFLGYSPDSTILWLGRSNGYTANWLGVKNTAKASTTFNSIEPSQTILMRGADKDQIDNALKSFNIIVGTKKRFSASEVFSGEYSAASKLDLMSAVTDLPSPLFDVPIKLTADVTPISRQVLAIKPTICNLFPYVHYVGDQGLVYSCSAWTVAGLKSIHDQISLKKELGLYETRNHFDRFYSPSYIFTLGKQKLKNDICSVGFDLSLALDILQDSGMPTIGQCPYFKNPWDCKVTISDEMQVDAKRNRVEPNKVDLDIISFQYILSHSCPIAVEVLIDEDFISQGKSQTNKWTWDTPYIWSDWNSQPNKKERKPHSMICIGYNDYRKAFLMLNSMGQGFGYSGTFWIDYDHMFKATRNAYCLQLGEFPSKEELDKQIIRTLNNNLVSIGNVKVVDIPVKSSSGTIFELKVKCASIQPMSDQMVVHLEINDKTGNLLRKDVAISNEVASFLEYDKARYYFQLLEVYKSQNIVSTIQTIRLQITKIATN